MLNCKIRREGRSINDTTVINELCRKSREYTAGRASVGAVAAALASDC